MEEIATNKKTLIKKLAQKYSLELLLLFGSRVTGKTHKESDYDIAYLSEKELTGKKQIELNCDLMNIFGSDKIDVSNIRTSPPFLNYEIAKKSKLLFGGEKFFLNFKTAAFKKYIDHLPLFDLRNFLIKKRQKALKELIYDK